MAKKNIVGSSGTHQWRFFRSGGLDQVTIDRGSDIAELGSLDQKLWVALACPVSGLHFDSRTLQLIDSDNDKRIRASELIAAAQWTVGLILDPETLLQGSPALPIASLNPLVPEAAVLAAIIKRILSHCGKPDAAQITLDDIAAFAGAFDNLPFNGDGIVTAQSADDDALKQGINDIIACIGGKPDRSGVAGIGQEEIDRFFSEAKAFAAWASAQETSTLPATADAASVTAAIDAVRIKIDDYFTRCSVVAFDPRAESALNRAEGDFTAMALKNLTPSSDEITDFPLARIGAQRLLPLNRGINPAWEQAVARFTAKAVVPILGERDTLSESEWLKIKEVIAPFQRWQQNKAGTMVEKLGIARVNEITAGTLKTSLDELMTKEKSAADDAAALIQIEKLVRLNRDLYRLCLNFVNFRDFYARQSTAIFQAGTLYLDQRSCDLCLRVEDPVRHSSMAALAGGYLAYCECTRVASQEKMNIVAAFTDGDSENLMTGRNGIFYSRDGRDWDATITRIVENPISLRQAFWSPYKNFVKMIEQLIARRAAIADTESSALLSHTATTLTTHDKPAPAPAKKIDVGTVAALGVAVGAIGTFFATILGYLTGIVKLGPLAIVGAFIGIIALISGPSLILAYIKLRKRNLGPILDASGWAINARAQISVNLGASLTRVAKLPAGAQRDLADPFADKKNPWPRAILITAAILYLSFLALDFMGFIHDWTKGRLGTSRAATVTPPAVKGPAGK